MESTPMKDITGAPIARPSRNLKRTSCQSTWLNYREAEQENKENIDWERINKKIPIMSDNHESDDDSGMASEEPMEIVESLRACRIRSIEATNEAGEPAEEPVVPIKRARIVKPIEDDTSARKSMAGAQPPSFLQREKENQQRREERRVYYDMLTKKTNPQPFKARPAPKFKPVAVQTPKKTEPKIPENPKPSTSTSISRTTTIVKPVLNPNGEIPVQKKTWTSKFTGDMFEGTSSTPLNMRRVSAPPMFSRRESMIPSRIPQSVATTQKTATPSPQTPKLSSSATTTRTPRRTVTIPKSPQLSTAIRARERRRFEEAMKERERQREHLLKIEQATIQAHERDSVAKLRRSSVHRALPNLSGVGLQPDQPKRPLTHPLLPIFVKRPRWI